MSRKVQHDTCGEPWPEDPCARWKGHPGRHEADMGRADELDHDDAMRVRLVEAAERQAAALEEIADTLGSHIEEIAATLSHLEGRVATHFDRVEGDE
ncbi:MAG: hypothetical protein ACHQC8_07085 [Solirubrobacterales bacterium]